jgi:hypothetical protein
MKTVALSQYGLGHLLDYWGSKLTLIFQDSVMHPIQTRRHVENVKMEFMAKWEEWDGKEWAVATLFCSSQQTDALSWEERETERAIRILQRIIQTKLFLQPETQCNSATRLLPQEIISSLNQVRSTWKLTKSCLNLIAAKTHHHASMKLEGWIRIIATFEHTCNLETWQRATQQNQMSPRVSLIQQHQTKRESNIPNSLSESFCVGSHKSLHGWAFGSLIVLNREEGATMVTPVQQIWVPF